MSKKEIDQVTGIETTGHVWDGDLRELNKPLPRWWLWTFYVTIIWGIGYMIAYPAWPTLNGYTKGMLGYSQRQAVTQEVADGKKAQSKFRDAIANSPLDKVRSDNELLRFASAGGKAAFGDYCAPCHGSGAQGATGYPNLLDDDWLWGGSLADIHKTIEFGVRSPHKESRINDMPKFGVDQILTPAQVSDVTEHVLSLSGKSTDKASAERGGKVYAEQCAACHGADGKGKEPGSPNLTDGIWLYGGSRDQVMESIHTGRGGMMPAWTGRLDPLTIKMLAVYVHSLGGGK